MITSISEDVTIVHRRGQLKDFEIAYKQLDNFVDKVNDKIINRLQLVQHVYFQDYKDQVKQMADQLKKLKQNLDAEVLYNKSSEKMFVLEEQRDFFREQVLKLNLQVNNLVQENKKLKSKLGQMSDQVEQYKHASFNLEKKVLKLQHQKTQMMNIKRQTSNQTIRRAFKTDQSQTHKQKSLHHTLEPKTEVCIQSRGSIREKPQIIKASRPRTYSKIQSATKASMRRYEQVNERDFIIDQCIKQTKKDILLRNNELKNQMLPFDQIAKITFDKFTRTDKKNVINKLLNNEKIVEEFADFLTARTPIESTSRMVRTKIGDDKFNQKFLVDLKRTFNRKMFEVKNSQLPNRKRQLDTE